MTMRRRWLRGHGARPFPVERHQVGDLRFQVRRSGQAGPDAVTFVLIHGLGMSHRSFSRLHRTLAGRDRAISITLPGFGSIAKPARPVTVEEMAAALAALLHRLQVSTAVIVGQSMGTQWAIELAAQRPDLAAHVVAVGPVADDRHRSLSAQMIALAIDSLRESPRTNAFVIADYVRCGPVWYLQQAKQMLEYRIEDRAHSMQAPLLVVRGSRDPIAGRGWCRRLRAAAPGASVAVVPGAAHHAQYFSPRAVAAAIRAFITNA